MALYKFSIIIIIIIIIIIAANQSVVSHFADWSVHEDNHSNM